MPRGDGWRGGVKVQGTWPDGLVRTWPSMWAASVELGIDRDTLNHVVNGTHGYSTHEYGGVNWKRLAERKNPTKGFSGKKHSEESLAKMREAKASKSRAVVLSKGGIDVVLNSCISAARFIGNPKSHSQIRQCCNSGKPYKGYTLRWM